MISHKHKCIFSHIPKTAGKSILALFGLPEFGKDYRGQCPHIEQPYDHMTLARYQGRDFFADYFKFSFVRNPWDRLVSAFCYLDNGGCNQWDEQFRREYLAQYNGNFGLFVKDIDRFIQSKHFAPQYLWTTDQHGQLLSDFVGKFENIQEDVRVVEEKVGLNPKQLPHRNKFIHKHYSEYYDKETKLIVAKKYAADIELFQYQFENF